MASSASTMTSTLVGQNLSISSEGDGTGELVKDARMISDALKTEETLLFIRQGTGTQATFPTLLSTALLVSLAYLGPLSFFWENRFGSLATGC